MIRALILFLVIVAGCTHVQGATTPLRVLVYNIHAGTDANRVSNVDRVAAIIRESRADIVLLQEVDRRTRRSGGVDQLDSLSKLTGLKGVFGRTLDYDGGEYGLGVLSRWEITSNSLVPLPVDAPHAGYESRGALIAEIERTGGRMRIVNTHLDASRPAYRSQQSTALLRAATEPRRADLIGGDLNSEPLEGVIGSLQSGGFRDLYPMCGAAPGFTFPVVEPTKRIDYLLSTPGWKCLSATVLSAHASDHRAVLFEVTRQ